MSVKLISTLHGRTQYKSDQTSAKLDLTLTNVDLTNVRCQTVIYNWPCIEFYSSIYVDART